MTYALLGVLSVALTDDAKSAPPLIVDLVPGHNQTKEFDKKLGSTGIDAGRNSRGPSSVKLSESNEPCLSRGRLEKRLYLISS